MIQIKQHIQFTTKNMLLQVFLALLSKKQKKSGNNELSAIFGINFSNMRLSMWKHIFLLLPVFSYAQDTIPETEDFSEYANYGDVSGVKRFATQKVLNQAPSRIVSIGYEWHTAFEMPDIPFGGMLPANQNVEVQSVRGLRMQVNLPVISNDRLIWQVGANYWGSKFDFANSVVNGQVKAFSSPGLMTAGINTTLFKPLDEKHLLIFQASADLNGAFQNSKDISTRGVTYSATAIYGWKKSEKNIIGAGLARTYRAGRQIYVPVLLWNRTFSDKWGMELLLPARGHIRRNFSTASMLQFGYELEGNQYHIARENSFLQRGEFKPRIIWDQKIAGFIWLQMQAGMRFNWRFDMMKKYDAKEDADRYFTSYIRNPFYFAFSLNFVSP
jgi:hypothetical protein